MRDIQDVLNFRLDISPFLAHLTRDRSQEGGPSAADALRGILADRRLVPVNPEISDARFGGNTAGLLAADKLPFFGAVSFSETPIGEVHCLLEIQNRNVNLAPYGLVFRKDTLSRKGVSPVLYLNNELADKDLLFQALFSLIRTHANEARQLLPLISVFGQKIQPPGAAGRPRGSVDWRWEREWRYPGGEFAIAPDDVFIGLCPHDEIVDFESYCQDIGWGHQLGFIDPHRSMKWYARKLIDARQRVDLPVSVV